MKTKNTKRILTLVLALVLVFALSVGAFADWVSFQKDATNNGTVPTGATPPTSTTPVISSLQLDTNGTTYIGVDTTPVIHGNNAYTVYNGGVVNGTAGGARLSSVNLTSGTSNWNIQLDADAKDVQQLCTPYYDATNNNEALYAGVSYLNDELSNKTMEDWESTAISGGTLTIPAHSTVNLTLTAMIQSGISSSSYFTTDIWCYNSGAYSGTVSMYNTADQTLYSFGTSYSYADSYFSLYNNNGSTLPSGTYIVFLSLTNDTDTAVTSNHIAYMLYKWRVYKVAITNNVASIPQLLKEGYGQIATPITAGSDNTNKYIYFGIYQGDRNYYQLNTGNTTDVRSFSVTSGEGYYWAGAAVVGSNVYFGSDEGYVYMRPIGSNFDSSSAGAYKNLTSIVSGPGGVRSSICYDGSNLYLTTKNAYLWQLDTSLTSAAYIRLVDSPYTMSCTSTPVVSANNYLYVGGYNAVYNTAAQRLEYYGELWTVPVSNFVQSTLQSLWVSTPYPTPDEGIQSSVVVYSEDHEDEESGVITHFDYLYFTTNGDGGKGYCAEHQVGSVSTSIVWNTGSAGTGYALQGVAVSDNGAVVFGNDSNKLFIVK